MGRHMAFWKYEKGTYLDNQKVYEQVCLEEKSAQGLCALPVNDILAEVNRVFADYDKPDDYNFESGRGSFTVSCTPQAVLFDCSWSMVLDDLNRIIDIMLGFGCPFYDPQITTRFDETQTL